MPPPLSSLRGRRSALRRRADGNVAAVSYGLMFPRPPLQPPDAPTRRRAMRPGDLDLLTLKVVSESRVTWATSVPILVFLGLSVLDLGPMYATDRQTSDSITTLCRSLLGTGHNNVTLVLIASVQLTLDKRRVAGSERSKVEVTKLQLFSNRTKAHR